MNARDRISSGILFLIALLFLTCFGPGNMAAQITFPGVSFGYEEALPLSDTTRLNVVLVDLKKLRKLGGVAFEGTAVPERAEVHGEIRLEYDPTRADGKRLVVFFGDEEVATRPLFDWALVPIAKFAQSSVAHCVTLFGELKDSRRTRKIFDEHGKVISLHPALEDCLLGWRLWQLDILILGTNNIELPKLHGECLLGAGESEPDPRDGLGACLALEIFNQRFTDEEKAFRSYVVSDYQRPVRFSVHKGILQFTGTPGWRFWRLRRDAPGYDKSTIVDSIRSKLSKRRRLLDSTCTDCSESLHLKRAQHLMSLLRQMDEDVSDRITGGAATLALNTEPEELEVVIAEVTASLHGNKIEHLEKYSEAISSRAALLRGINPAVFDAATDLMTYAAFFRYVRRQAPAAWAAFLSQLGDVSVTPAVRTPTIMMTVK